MTSYRVWNSSGWLSVQYPLQIEINGRPKKRSISIAAKSTVAVTEGTDAVFTVTADAAPAADLPVSLTVADAPNADFVSSTNQGSGKSVTIQARQTTADSTGNAARRRVGRGIMHLPVVGILASSEVVLEVKQEGLRRWPSPTPLPFTRHRHRTTPVG
ncbi:MAG: hypothetical protein F4218_10075 [Synechococcus sp. SB0677_bin_5]|nr:hypothetical protein [Synechococcus sp. SB0677_bin_5]